jgi:peptide/nickel transport system permease protein
VARRVRLGRLERFVLRRTVSLLVVLFLLLVATFMMIHLIPGDPARRIAGREASPDVVASIRQSLGLNDPLPVQFWAYFRRTLRLDFGTSFISHEPVSTVIASRLPKTAELAAAAFVTVMVLSLPVGILAGALTRERRHPKTEVMFTGVTSVGGALPHYLTATFLAFIFAVWLKVLPVAGSSGWKAIILPTAAIALRPVAVLARIVRVETLNVEAQDYMRTARSKRLPTYLLYFRHVLPNVLTAALTLGGLLFAGLIAGVVVVENVFAWPGLGTSLVQAVLARDYPVVQGLGLLFGVAVVVINTIVDVILSIVDPRSLVATS